MAKPSHHSAVRAVRIVGEPRQQEFAHPTLRRVDSLYDLADGSLLNVEHQSSLKDRDALARRLIEYRCMIRGRFPLPRVLHQVVVFNGKKPRDRRRIADLVYDDVDGFGGGVQFRATVKDFLVVPPDVFRASGTIEDRILGVLATGASDRAYMAEVKRIREMIGELDIWIDELKDNRVAQRFVEIASRERIEAAKREGIATGMATGMAKGVAKFLVRHAVAHNVALVGSVEETESLIAARADEEALYAMLEDTPNMDNHRDIASFLTAHGVDVSRS